MLAPATIVLAQTNYVDCAYEVNGGGIVVVLGSSDSSARAINLQSCRARLASGLFHAATTSITPAQLSTIGYVAVCTIGGEGFDSQLDSYAWQDLHWRSMAVSLCEAVDQTVVSYYPAAPLPPSPAEQAALLAQLGAPEWLISSTVPTPAPSPTPAPFPAPRVSANDQYSTVNGVKSAEDMREELAAVGYSGPGDVPSLLAAYQRTTNAPVYPL
jgi:hypothetical protein